MSTDVAPHFASLMQDVTHYGGETSSGFHLDRPQRSEVSAGRPANSSMPPREQDESLLSAKILIVDDEPINVKVCQKYLNELGYKQCITLTDSTRAIDVIMDERPDVVILDVMMPILSGVDVLKLIRQHGELDHLPVQILTASSDRTTKLTVLNLGATDFLTKPVDPSEMAPRIRNVLAVKRYHDTLRKHAEALEELVRQRTADLETARNRV